MASTTSTVLSARKTRRPIPRPICSVTFGARKLQRCFQERDGQHHAKPDEDNRDCYGPRETHLAGLLQRIMVFISLVEHTRSDAEGGVSVRYAAVNSGLQQDFFDLFPR